MLRGAVGVQVLEPGLMLLVELGRHHASEHLVDDVAVHVRRGDKLLEPEINEVFLFHGTSEDVADVIVHMGDHAYNEADGDERRADGYMSGYMPTLTECPWFPIGKIHPTHPAQPTVARSWRNRSRCSNIVELALHYSYVCYEKSTHRDVRGPNCENISCRPRCTFSPATFWMRLDTETPKGVRETLLDARAHSYLADR